MPTLIKKMFIPTYSDILYVCGAGLVIARLLSQARTEKIENFPQGPTIVTALRMPT
jgi:hypothetical protein